MSYVSIFKSRPSGTLQSNGVVAVESTTGRLIPMAWSNKFQLMQPQSVASDLSIQISQNCQGIDQTGELTTALVFIAYMAYTIYIPYKESYSPYSRRYSRRYTESCACETCPRTEPQHGTAWHSWRKREYSEYGTSISSKDPSCRAKPTGHTKAKVMQCDRVSTTCLFA